MKKTLIATPALASLALALASPSSAEVPQNLPPSSPTIGTVQPMQLMVQIPLACSGSGASDVVSRKHSIKNTTGHAIPKGTVVHWTASNKGSGSLTLSSDLAPDASVDVIEPGQTNGYTCTAGFYPGNPDFAVKSVQWTSATTASVEIANLNPWSDAKASTVRVQSLKCIQSPVGSVDAQAPAIPKGGSVTVTVNGLPKSAADYLMATANATSTAPEGPNKANNVGKSPEFGSNKSCTPH